jgi:hypothetical protein
MGKLPKITPPITAIIIRPVDNDDEGEGVGGRALGI